MTMRLTANLTSFLFLMLLYPSASTLNHRTVFVVFGGNGDLAAKYLWQGIFNVYQAQTEELTEERIRVEGSQGVNRTFDFFSVGRTNQEKGTVLLNEILKSNVRCNEDGEEPLAVHVCEKKRKEMLEKVSYISALTDEDFTFLCSEITSKFSSEKGGKVIKEVMLYMAIAPSSYESVLQKFYNTCKSKGEQDIQWKLALEKPFGLNRESVELVSEKMLNFFQEEEIYRVDHYLGKPVVQSILPFRALNKNIERSLNKDHVDRVEIFLKETVGVEERLDVYNSLGVLRDVHQNHLTELLTLVAMDVPADLRNTKLVNENKERLLRQVESVRRHNSLFGQYSEYKDQLKSLPSNASVGDNVPTFAAAVVKINSPRWKSVPFLLVSGKKLDQRETYVRIVFKNNFVCVSHCLDDSLDDEGKHTKQIIFHIGHGSMKRPSILVAKSFGDPLWPENVQESIDPTLFSSSVAYGERFDHFYVGSVGRNTLAYESVLGNILAEKREFFVNSRHLSLSWRIWDYLVGVEKSIRIYESFDPHEQLNFIMKESQLEFSHSPDDILASEQDKTLLSHSDRSHHDYTQSSATFLGRRLVTSRTDTLAFLLAQEIDRAAEVEIQTKGSFHIAFPGGQSVVKLFQVLAQSLANLHWQSIHVWQLDERCVPHQDERSNFQVLDRELLRFVDIPYANIHSMPVVAGGRLCDQELGGAHAYADALRHAVPNSQLDFIVLGAGADGHVASLFPASSVLHVDSSTLVVTHDEGPDFARRRMTLTLPAINRAKHVAILATGKHKQEVISKLEGSKSVDEFPVLGVHPVNGTLSWYMDYDAYFPGQ
ncbi:GDH/6PGL endoplasmic bifunctional protein [Aplysia californica]|uniref:GDH/6PGL endoplasmic bifunctional protein n=1 Tax=Aplysia californica TaxID=6500 RepID=A0ABM1A6K6_APLCA|nr:GDH/6PGL endoplasmic bifunctional protein [Aplysia californica]